MAAAAEAVAFAQAERAVLGVVRSPRRRHHDSEVSCAASRATLKSAAGYVRERRSRRSCRPTSAANIRGSRATMAQEALPERTRISTAARSATMKAAIRMQRGAKGRDVVTGEGYAGALIVR